MKKVLIVGKNSYIGTSLLNSSKCLFDIVVIDSKKPIALASLRGFDSIVHVAGIAHVSPKKRMKDLYMKVNRDLAIETAINAKNAGVGQFVFMSSMIIYGQNDQINKPFIISKDTKPNPTDFYGESKYEADIAIQKLNSDSFHTVVIRAPMVYGQGCSGNYPRLQKLALYLPILPNLRNQRTVISLDNLIRVIQDYIESDSSGVFYPRDSKPMCTYDVMVESRKKSGKKVVSTKLFNPLIRFFGHFVGSLRKMFSSKIYSDELPIK
jgi:nucleoside-diphosphate-sugar epimerase